MEVMDLAGRGCVEVASSRNERLYLTHPYHSHLTSGLDVSIRVVGTASPGRGVDLCGWRWGIRGRKAGEC